MAMRFGAHERGCADTENGVQVRPVGVTRTLEVRDLELDARLSMVRCVWVTVSLAR